MIHLVNITVLNLATKEREVLRFCSDVGFNTAPDETPPNAVWDPGLTEPMHFTREMFGGENAGESRIGAGVIEVLNTDGWLDKYSAPAAYAFDGQPFEVLTGWPGQRIQDFSTSFFGVQVAPEFNVEKVVFNCRDMQELLNKPLPIPKYAGTNSGPNGIDGTEDDLKDTVKPLCLGYCPNVTGKLVNTSKRIWQVHFRSCEAILSMKSNANGLTFDGDDPDHVTLRDATIPSGHFRTCNAMGLARDNTEGNTKITFDVKGDNVGGYVDTTAGIMGRIFEIMNDPNLVWSTEDLAALDLKNPAVVGLFDDSGENSLNLLDMLCEGPWFWFCPNRTGVHRFGRIELPSNEPRGSWHDDQSIELDQVAGDGIAGAPFGLLTCRFGRNWTVMKDNEVASVALPELVAWLAQEFREAASTSDGQPDPAVLAEHPYAPSVSFDSLFVNKADALAEVARRVAMRGAGLRPFVIRRAWESVQDLELNDTFSLYSRRFLLAGLHVAVARIEEMLSVNVSEIACYG